MCTSAQIRDALAVMQSPYGYGASPALGCITFVDPKKVRGVHERGELVKGFCFKRAGFRAVGETASGLIVWQLVSKDFPPALRLPEAA